MSSRPWGVLAVLALLVDLAAAPASTAHAASTLNQLAQAHGRY